MVIDQYEDLVKVITQNAGKFVVTLGKEFIFNFRYPNLMSFHEKYIDQAEWLSVYERHEKSPMPMVTSIMRREIYEKEKYERDMILNDLKFSTHIMMSKYDEPIDSRRFVATNDSCLSFTQVTIDHNYYRWVFVSRSTEVNKMLPADLRTIGYIIDEWIKWFIKYKHKHFNPDRGIHILFILNNPHYFGHETMNIK